MARQTCASTAATRCDTSMVCMSTNAPGSYRMKRSTYFERWCVRRDSFVPSGLIGSSRDCMCCRSARGTRRCQRGSDGLNQRNPTSLPPEKQRQKRKDSFVGFWRGRGSEESKLSTASRNSEVHTCRISAHWPYKQQQSSARKSLSLPSNAQHSKAALDTHGLTPCRDATLR